MKWTMPRLMTAYTVPEADMLRAIHAVGLPEPVHQHRFVAGCCDHPKARHRTRQWASRKGHRLGICSLCPGYHDYDAGRRWRFDFAWPDRMISLEVEGLGRREQDGTWNPTGGGHQTRIGFEKDCEKYNSAVIMGWRLIRVTSTMITDGRAIEYVEAALQGGTV